MSIFNVLALLEGREASVVNCDGGFLFRLPIAAWPSRKNYGVYRY